MLTSHSNAHVAFPVNGPFAPLSVVAVVFVKLVKVLGNRLASWSTVGVGPDCGIS